MEEDVAAAGDGGPALDLGGGRGSEGTAEPGRDGRREARERVLGGRGRGWAGGRVMKTSDRNYCRGIRRQYEPPQGKSLR